MRACLRAVIDFGLGSGETRHAVRWNSTIEGGSLGGAIGIAESSAAVGRKEFDDARNDLRR